MSNKILILPDHLKGKTGGGIGRYCRMLGDLFKDSSDFNVKVSEYLPEIPYKFLGHAYNMRQLEDYLRSESPDIVHVNGYTNRILKQIVELSHKLNYKIVYTAHWHPFETMNKCLLKKAFFSFFVKPYLKKVNGIITINNDERNFFTNLGFKNVMIPHWNVQQLEKAQNIINAKPKLLFVGRTRDANKGFEHLLKIPLDKYEIHVVGDPIEVNRNDFIFHNKISNDELIKLYQDCNLTICPSRYEAFSYVALESLSNGTPILISQNVRIADHLPDESYTIFEYKNYGDFLSKIEPAMKIVVNLDMINKIFNKESAYKSYKKLYEDVLK